MGQAHVPMDVTMAYVRERRVFVKQVGLAPFAPHANQTTGGLIASRVSAVLMAHALIR